MIKAKHFLERIEADDGPRMWIEPVGLAKELQEWRCVDHVLPHLGPPRDLWEWFVAHPDQYEDFRAQYHEWLSNSPYRPALQWLACECLEGNLTLVHAGDDADHNCATALHEFIGQLEVYCASEQPSSADAKQAEDRPPSFSISHSGLFSAKG